MTALLILELIVLAVEVLFTLVQIIGFVAWKMKERHWKKYHNFDTFWWYVDDFLDPVCIW